jgi:hypothetical protein
MRNTRPSPKTQQLDWIDRGDTFHGHHQWEATSAIGRYTVGPTFTGPSFEFVGYHASHHVDGKFRHIKDSLATAEQAKAVAQRDYDYANRGRPEWAR